MYISPKVVSCWPGLPRLWFCGDWLSLVGAVAFGVVVNLLLVSMWARPLWLPASVVVLAALALAGFWLVSVIQSWRNWDRTITAASSMNDQGLFLRAQSEYLQGHWFEAESACGQLLQLSGRDVEVRLLLATLYRHTSRWDAATAELDRIEQFEGADRWRTEIVAERRLLRRAGSLPSVGDSPVKGKSPEPRVDDEITRPLTDQQALAKSDEEEHDAAREPDRGGD